MVHSTDNCGDENVNVEELWEFVAGSGDIEDEEEIPKHKRVVNPGHKRKPEKTAQSPEALAAIVEQLMAIFEIACEDDIVLNSQSKPCINKLKTLPLLIESLSKIHLQKVFIDHGIFTLLKNWLEPLPDGSIPNIEIRRSILVILTDQFRVKLLNGFFVREQLRKSGLGKVIMFLSQSNEETKSNQKLAKDLVNNWSRVFYNISMNFEDARPICKPAPKRPCIRMSEKKDLQEKDQDQDPFEIYEFSSGHKKISKSNIYSRAQLPEATSMKFVFSPQTNVKRSCANESDRKTSIIKKLRQMKAKTRRSSTQI